MKQPRDRNGRFARTCGREDATAGQAHAAPANAARDGIATCPAGTSGPKRRRAKAAPSKRERLTIFFRELSLLCNVSEALRRSGLEGQSSTVYDLRRADAGFRARWEDAICESFAMLELEVLERTRFGENRPAPETDVEKRLRQVSTRQALQLLKLYKDRVKAREALTPPAPRRRMDRREAREIRIRVEKMLSDFNRRMGGEG